MEEAGAENARQIQNYEKERRDKVIKRLKNKGLSIRQIERLTGISFAIIRRI
jgi:transposase